MTAVNATLDGEVLTAPAGSAGLHTAARKRP